MLPDAQDIIEFFQAGPRKCRGAKFAAIAKERADHVAHMEKSPSFIQCKMCLGAHCSACAGVIEKRRASQTSWDPAKILAPLQFNNGWFPFPYFRNGRDEASAEARAAGKAGDREPNEAAEEHPPGGTATPGTAAQVLVPESDNDDDGTESRSSAFAPVARGGTATPTEGEIMARQPNSAHRPGTVVEAADGTLRLHKVPPLGIAESVGSVGTALDSIAALLEAAVRRQDFSEAARLKAALQAEKEEVLKLQAALQLQAALLPRPEAVAVPTLPDDVWATRTKQPFLHWPEVLLRSQPQNRVLIPTEWKQSKRIERLLPCRHKHCRYWSSSMAEHIRHGSHDHLVPLRKAKAKAKAKAGKAKASRAADDEDPTGRRANGAEAEAADPSAADARRTRAAKRPRPRRPVLKALLPFEGKNPGCKISLDLNRCCYNVTYDHRDVPTNIVEQLPDKYKNVSHDPGTFGPEHDPATMDAKLTLALDWVWEKHYLMTSEIRPKETTSTAQILYYMTHYIILYYILYDFIIFIL